ncbi:asparagine synthase (glutamine-hydrolyzing) [Hespellia stercorisuis]|uniref:asparagine synthase (glutamine-hydrolyzing) n=1 Tax=Hespellia stercorisuis DSM 15480 TaxID=1121950 RepID=A0A1M6IMD0_9FIRM|nr:asparagine synthase (glutamine-hydrolyzing) [Hespellia stercorisuis]SHJ35545.1 asparagine synthase (glutamine-hydrolysing) [Hespellia stercorisuis DSM 15480]
MCGFVGYVGQVENREKVLVNMMNTIVHRGPDSEGRFVDDTAALGFRRLSIIDLSEAGSQPLYNEDNSKVLVFNGEIYNYQELRKELVAAGHIFTSNTDSETLLHGYEEWGEKLLARLRGMYAFVIWDKKTKKMFGARDIFGIKPLYYAHMNDTLMLASEIKAFMEHPNFVKEFNEDALGNYLSFQFVPTNETFFKGVFCVQPGHYFTYEDGQLEIKRYFEPHFTGNNKKSFEEVVDDVEQVMKESVEMHKISDVEVASYLSSGVDSSYLTYLGQVDHTFTVGFDEGKYSEIQDAKEFAASINMENDAKVISPEEYWENLSDIQYYMDEPVADPAAIALYFLSEEASKKVKVVLSGEGSDELFGGYNIYCEPLEHTRFNIIPMPVRRALGRFAENHMKVGTKGRGFLMRHGKTLEERYFANATNIFTEKEANRVLKKGCEPKIQQVTAPLYARVKGKDPVTKMQYLDLHLWLVHDILMKGDKMGMANSLEVRVPFLDREVLKLAETLPLDYKVRAPKTKVALRGAAEKVIRSKTAEKKKLGFPIPIRVWLKEEKYYNIVKEMFASEGAKKFFDTEYLNQLLEDHRNGVNTNEKTDNSRKIWTVYIFLVWYDRYFGHGKPVHPQMKRDAVASTL